MSTNMTRCAEKDQELKMTIIFFHENYDFHRFRKVTVETRKTTVKFSNKYQTFFESGFTEENAVDGIKKPSL